MDLAADTAASTVPTVTATLVDPSAVADAVAMCTDQSDAVSEKIRSSVAPSVKDEDLRPRVGLSFLSMQEADAFVRVAGARTAPYRLLCGATKSRRHYACRSRSRDGARTDADDCCCAEILVQKCTVRQLMNGTVKR